MTGLTSFPRSTKSPVIAALPGNWTFVIVTDREDLDGQIYRNFASTGAVIEDESPAMTYAIPVMSASDVIVRDVNVAPRLRTVKSKQT